MTEGPFANETSEGLDRDLATAYAGTSEPEGPAKRVVLASLGAAATACDVANEQFDRFVNRGNQVQTDLMRRTDDFRLQSMGSRSRMGQTVRSAMNAFLDGINVPNKADVDVINAKLNIVTRKLDDLQFQGVQDAGRPAASAPGAPATPADETAGTTGI